MEWVRRRKEERERQKREQEMVASPVEEEGPRTPSLQTAEAQGHTQAIPIPTRADLVPSEARDIDYFGENVSPAGSDRDEESEDGEGEDDDDEQEEKDVARWVANDPGGLLFDLDYSGRQALPLESRRSAGTRTDAVRHGSGARSMACRVANTTLKVGLSHQSPHLA